MMLGRPLWYELMTPDPDAAAAFYGPLVGWTVEPSGMEGVDYRMFATPHGRVAGMMAMPGGEVPPNWMIYFGADDLDATLAAMVADGAAVVTGPQDVPGVGRFAVLTDPQGAHFGLLQPPAGMRPEGTPPYSQPTWGHGCWHELMTSDPEAAVAFYARHLGWTLTSTLDMGGTPYRIVARDGADLAGIMPSGENPAGWMPVFGRQGIDAAAAEITAAGGAILFGPAEVPGGVFALSFRDPQGAFAELVGPK